MCSAFFRSDRFVAYSQDRTGSCGGVPMDEVRVENVRVDGQVWQGNGGVGSDALVHSCVGIVVGRRRKHRQCSSLAEIRTNPLERRKSDGVG